MMIFDIIDATTTNVVRLRQARVDVRHVLGVHRTFRRTADSAEADQFTESGVIASYSEGHLLRMLEFHAPAEVEVRGVTLLGERLDSVTAALEASGLEVEVDDLGAVIPGLSVELYAPAGIVEGVQMGNG